MCPFGASIFQFIVQGKKKTATEIFISVMIRSPPGLTKCRPHQETQVGHFFSQMTWIRDPISDVQNPNKSKDHLDVFSVHLICKSSNASLTECICHYRSKICHSRSRSSGECVITGVWCFFGFYLQANETFSTDEQSTLCFLVWNLYVHAVTIESDPWLLC